MVQAAVTGVTSPGPGWSCNNATPGDELSTGGVKKKGDLKKFQIALTDSILKLKSIVIPLNQMSQSEGKHAQD